MQRGFKSFVGVLKREDGAFEIGNFRDFGFVLGRFDGGAFLLVLGLDWLVFIISSELVFSHFLQSVLVLCCERNNSAIVRPTIKHQHMLVHEQRPDEPGIGVVVLKL